MTNYETKAKNVLTKTAKETLKWTGNRNPSKTEITERSIVLRGLSETPSNELEFQRFTSEIRIRTRSMYGVMIN